MSGEQLRQLSRQGDESGVKELLKKLENPEEKNNLKEALESKDEYSGNTALHFSCANGHIDIVNALIDVGAKINAVNLSGSTPLHYASLTGQTAVVQSLVKSGADLIHRNNFERTPMDEALQSGHREVADILMKAVEEKAAGKEPEGLKEMTKESKEKKTRTNKWES